MNKDSIRLLSFDGGGMRAHIQICILEKMIQKILQTYDKIQGETEFIKILDIIAGTSIGGILALGLAFGMKLEEIKTILLEKGKRIFTIRTVSEVITRDILAKKDSNRPGELQKLLMLLKGAPFYESKNPASNYGSSILHKTLFDIFGNARLTDLNVPVLIPAYQKDTNKGVWFSNLDHPLCFGKDSKIIDVARATSAAPIYFPPYSFDGHVYLDGGLICNNPTFMALLLARSLKRKVKTAWVLSLGTGLKK